MSLCLPCAVTESKCVNDILSEQLNHWEQWSQSPWARPSLFGWRTAATQQSLRTGGAFGFNYGSVLSWEKASFHSHISSLVTFSHYALLRLLSVAFHLNLVVVLLPFFHFVSPSSSTIYHAWIHPLSFLFLLSFVPSTSPFFHFILLLGCFLPLSPHLIQHSLLSFLCLFLLLALPLSGPKTHKKEANFHLITSLISQFHTGVDRTHNLSLLI